MRYILVIDPGIGPIQLDAINLLGRLAAETKGDVCLFSIALEEGKRRLRDRIFDKAPPLDHVREFCEMAQRPSCDHSVCDELSQRPCESIGVGEIAGIISLGSDANVTDTSPWILHLAEDLKPLLTEQQIPFLGSCFSHQLLASILGSKVDYRKPSDRRPAGHLKGTRRIRIIHPRMAALFGDAPPPFEVQIPVWHEQEVLEIPESCELAATSAECKIDGLVHKELPIFSLQSHPEWYQPSGTGWNFIRNFIAFAAQHRNG